MSDPLDRSGRPAGKPAGAGISFAGLFDPLAKEAKVVIQPRLEDITLLREQVQEQQAEIDRLRDFQKELYQMVEDLQGEVRRLRTGKTTVAPTRDASPARKPTATEERKSASTTTTAAGPDCTYILLRGADAGKRCPNRATHGDRCLSCRSKS